MIEFKAWSKQGRVGIDEGRFVALQEICGRKSAVKLHELRLVVEEFQLARRAGHKQVNDSLGFRSEVRSAGRKGVGGSVGGIGAGASQVSHRQCAHSDAAALQKPAAGELFGIFVSIQMVLAIHGYSLVMVSSRFSRTRETAVHAALVASAVSENCAGARPKSVNRRPSFFKSESSSSVSAPSGTRPTQRRKA